MQVQETLTALAALMSPAPRAQQGAAAATTAAVRVEQQLERMREMAAVTTARPVRAAGGQDAAERGGRSAGRVVLDAAGRVFPMVRLVSALIGGLRRAPAPAPLLAYQRAQRQELTLAYDSRTQQAAEVRSGELGRSEAVPARAAGPQVVVQVQAMDSRSFLEHSGDIASAVRRALLESHALSDVVGEI